MKNKSVQQMAIYTNSELKQISAAAEGLSPPREVLDKFLRLVRAFPSMSSPHPRDLTLRARKHVGLSQKIILGIQELDDLFAKRATLPPVEWDAPYMATRDLWI